MSNLLEQLLRADGPVLVTGPVGSGLRELGLAFARRHRGEDGRTTCLLLAPNGVTAERFQRQWLDESRDGDGVAVLLSPPIMTFAALAGRLLAGAGRPATPLSPAVRHQRLRQIVRELADAKSLRALGPGADTPGVIATLDRCIAELKRATVEPDDLDRAIRARAAATLKQDQQADLLAVYRRYQAFLNERNLVDVEGQMWLARTVLEDPALPTPALADIEAVAVVGFTDFTPTQLHLLRRLSPRVKRLLVTLPHGQDSRIRMWRWTKRTRTQLRATFRAFGARLQTYALDAPHGTGETPASRSPLAGLAEGVFDLAVAFGPQAARRPVPSGLTVIAAAGQEAELSAVARRVKRRLVDGAGPGHIAVLARSLDDVAPTLERVFAEHRIPITPRGVPLMQSPPVRFLLDAAAVGEGAGGTSEPFHFCHVLRTLRSSYFRAGTLGDFDERTTVAAEALIREGNVLYGRRTYAHAAERLKAALTATTAADSKEADPDGPATTTTRLTASTMTPDDLTRAAAMLETLFDACEAATSPEGLLSLIERLALRRTIVEQASHRPMDAARIADDLRTLATLESTLRALRDDTRDAGETLASQTSLADLRQALSAVTVPARRGESLVDVLDVLDARALSYDHVFLIGLEEGAFPRPPREGAFIQEADRKAWAGHGVTLDERGDLNAREMLLFYLAISRAKHSLTLSYQSSDSAGKPKLPSPFLSSLLAPIGGLQALDACGRLVKIPVGEFVPNPTEIATDRDAFTAQALALLNKNVTRTSDPSPAAPAASTLDFLAAGLLAMHRRWRQGPCDGFDGVLNEASQHRLRKILPEDKVFSASSLNTYGQCPWQFFATYILRLHPLVEPERQLEAADKGTFCHNVLCRVLRELTADDRDCPLSDMGPSRVEMALHQAVAAEAARVERDGAVAYPALWALQREQFTEHLRDYLRQITDTGDGQWQAWPMYCEYAFGQGHDDDLRDPASLNDPVTIDLPGADGQPGVAVRLRGRIDRIDHVESGGRSGLFVVDYKTGPPPSRSDILQARNVQLPLYEAAAKVRLGERFPGVDWLGGAFHQVDGPGRTQIVGEFRKPRKGEPPPEEFRRQALANIAVNLQAMRRGDFHALPNTRKCPPHCPYRQICHHAPARAKRKIDAG